MSIRSTVIKTSPWNTFLSFLQTQKSYSLQVIPHTNIIYCKKKGKEIIFIDRFWSIVPHGIGLALASDSTVKLILKYAGYEDESKKDIGLSCLTIKVYVDIYNTTIFLFRKPKTPLLLKNHYDLNLNTLENNLSQSQKNEMKGIAKKFLRLMHPCPYVLVEFSIPIDNLALRNNKIVPVNISLDLVDAFFNTDPLLSQNQLPHDYIHKFIYKLLTVTSKKLI